MDVVVFGANEIFEDMLHNTPLRSVRVVHEIVDNSPTCIVNGRITTITYINEPTITVYGANFI